MREFKVNHWCPSAPVHPPELTVKNERVTHSCGRPPHKLASKICDTADAAVYHCEPCGECVVVCSHTGHICETCDHVYQAEIHKRVYTYLSEQHPDVVASMAETLTN